MDFPARTARKQKRREMLVLLWEAPSCESLPTLRALPAVYALARHLQDEIIFHMINETFKSTISGYILSAFSRQYAPRCTVAIKPVCSWLISSNHPRAETSFGDDRPGYSALGGERILQECQVKPRRDCPLPPLSLASLQNGVSQKPRPPRSRMGEGARRCHHPRNPSMERFIKPAE